MMTISCELEFEKEDKIILDDVCRHWSSAKHTAFNALIENPEINLHKQLQNKFNINYRYAHTAIVDAEAQIQACEELEINPQKVIFGSRKLFGKLKRKHLSEKQRTEIKE